MQKKYQALDTKIFNEGQILADMVKGRTYLADKEEEYFIGEFGDTIYINQNEFDLYFREVKQKSYQSKAKTNYKKRATKNGKNKMLCLTLFAEKDKDIIEHLDSITETIDDKRASKGGRGGKTDYIRRLIREDIAKNGGVKN